MKREDSPAYAVLEDLKRKATETGRDSVPIEVVEQHFDKADDTMRRRYGRRTWTVAGAVTILSFAFSTVAFCDAQSKKIDERDAKRDQLIEQRVRAEMKADTQAKRLNDTEKGFKAFKTAASAEHHDIRTSIDNLADEVHSIAAGMGSRPRSRAARKNNNRRSARSGQRETRQ